MVGVGELRGLFYVATQSRSIEQCRSTYYEVTMMRGIQRVVGVYSMMLPLAMIAGSLILSRYAPAIPAGVSLSDPGAQALVSI